MSRKNVTTLAALAVFASVGFAGTALADECTDTIAMVEEAAASAQLADQDKASIMGMIADARAKQSAGDTQGCTMTLAEAKTVLQIN